MAAWAQGELRREAILVFLHDYMRQNQGRSPSIAQITQGVGLASKTAVRHHLGVLGKDGLVSANEGEYRSIRLTSAGERKVKTLSSAAVKAA